MKDYGYYKNILKKHYNLGDETLTKSNFYLLRNKIIEGDQKSVDELFRLSCFYTYDIAAHDFAQTEYPFAFEDAIQTVSLVLFKMKKGEITTKRGTKYFSQLSVGTSFSKFEQELKVKLAKIYKILGQNEINNQTPFIKQSNQIYSYLSTPENVAVTNLNRSDIAEKIMEVAPGFKKTRHKTGEAAVNTVLNGKTLQDVADEHNVTRQNVHRRLSDLMKILRKPENRDTIKELLS